MLVLTPPQGLVEVGVLVVYCVGWVERAAKTRPVCLHHCLILEKRVEGMSWECLQFSFETWVAAAVSAPWQILGSSAHNRVETGTVCANDAT